MSNISYNKKYIIDCNPYNYELTNNLLMTLDEVIIISKMPNLDHTSDFVINCNDIDAEFLKSSGINIYPDGKITFNSIL